MKLIVKKSKKKLFRTVSKVKTKFDGEDIVISTIELIPTKNQKIRKEENNMKKGKMFSQKQKDKLTAKVKKNDLIQKALIYGIDNGNKYALTYDKALAVWVALEKFGFTIQYKKGKK